MILLFWDRHFSSGSDICSLLVGVRSLSGLWSCISWIASYFFWCALDWDWWWITGLDEVMGPREGG